MQRWVGALGALVLAMSLGPGAEASATPNVKVSGTFAWAGTNPVIVDLPGGSTVSSGPETLTWTGTLAGRSNDFYQMVTTAPAVEGVNCCGAGYGTETAVFVGKVAGQYGKLVLYLTYYWPAGPAPRMHHGTWTILSGTGRLELVTGSGTWVRFADGSARATYTGSISRY